MPTTKPAFFKQDGAHFLPLPAAANPWFDNAVAGGPLTGLFGHLIEQHDLAPPGFTVARMTIDILGIVPSAPLLPTITAIRTGRQMQLHQITLTHANRPVAQCLVLVARELATPATETSLDHPLPDAVPQAPFLAHGTLAKIVRTRPIEGSVTRPGRGIVWLALDADIVAGYPATAFAKACVFADFGNGVGSATHAYEWSFANLDVGIQWLREPQGDWCLLDAETTSGGNGHALARTIMSDQTGIFAIATQTVFVAPGANTPRMQARSTATIG